MLSKLDIETRATKLRENATGPTLWAGDDFDPAAIIALGIQEDICERGGLKQAWAEIPDEKQCEIRSIWRELAKQVICLVIMKK